MIPDSVTLIVKAPNQQIEDQNIECQSSWTVAQLKGHLSEVYPSKPRTDQQKIIYSGQLLEDKTVLKDILRTYESQIVHTMHLVCTPKRKMAEPQKPEQSTEGLRHRTVPENRENTERPAETASRPETRQNDQNHTVEMQNYLSSFVNNYGRVPPYPNYNFGEGYLPVPNDPALLANHMMMMQQAYLQYMQQYANMWQASTAAPAAPPTPAPPPPPAPAPRGAPPDDADDALAPRDWLDHLYSASRMAILFSLIYLYGSPARLLLVLLLAAAGYLHQIGFFRDFQINQDQIQANRRNEPPAANQAEAAPQAAAGQGDGEPEAAGEAPPPPQPQPQPTTAPQQAAADNGNNQSLLAVTWMIFTSFFASLIPDAN
ncbi:homocysteine-responsive endoplasmic reticulum-resident ubiquitin-like domain member 2 protein [Galleria mellonella]|uniref:Homocysteine-responsive endoplasmic reticulum-resident ubiquitin-like domain member 2 protein n=1 Tax=Galleria mellonella TaxID=7137 RepID=A0A6J1W7Q0_GALME|nr:homocysteine-responsive endoplasmic reticulum-resident ubiquitin-like domain member 2 protein [Galleria mellonella]